MKDCREKVYALVRQIPEGKVTTYGEIGKKLHISPRTVGHALHLNPDSNNTPCHRVVDRNGRVAPSYAFGGLGAQKKLLEQENINFKDGTHADLKLHFYGFT